MSESTFQASYQQMCFELLALRKTEWDRTYSTFEAYVAYRWSLSKSRAKLYCDFAKFCAMCRKEYIKVPDSPDNIAPLLALRQGDWLDVWKMARAEADPPMNANQWKAFLQRFHMTRARKVPEHVLNGRRVRKAAQTLADIGDGEKLVEQIGPKGLGSRWGEAVTVVIDADQAAMSRR